MNRRPDLPAAKPAIPNLAWRLVPGWFPRVDWLLGAIFALAYLALSLPYLDRAPAVHEDEPYIAASAETLATRGTLGNPLFTGFHGVEQHVFLHPPLLPVAQAPMFRVAGASLVTARMPGILAGLGVLLLTLTLAHKLRGTAGAVLAGALLLAFPLGAGWTSTSGVPLLDIARVARPDVLVPALALAALLIFERAGRRDSTRAQPDSPETARATWLWFATGALIGCATLAHLYGAFYGIAFLLILAARPGARRSRLRAALLIAAGAALVLAPVAVWILANFQDFTGQQRLLATRYTAFDARFLAHNVLTEVQRYRTLLPFDITPASLLARPALWIGAPLGILAFAKLFRRAAREREGLEFAISVTLLANVLLFALLLQVKTYAYLIAFWPLAVLVIAMAAVDAWRAPGRPLRWLAGIALTVVLAEGGLALRGWRAQARTVTPYADFTRRISDALPAGAHVLGLQRYWLGLHAFRYTSWLLPVWQSDARFAETAMPIDQAIERAAPDFILMDNAMSDWFASISSSGHPDHARYLQWQSYQQRHNLALVAAVTDATYGVVRILRVE